ncbi:MAG: hypothetical protein QHG99_06545 [Methanomicrobiales archaeon]|nr:hypothetical protein [Methanomicrobiales archaeon]
MSAALSEIRFPKIGHFWIDSGLIGFYELACRNHAEKNGVRLNLDDQSVTIKGDIDDIEKFLQSLYLILLDKYYNTSNEKQEQEKAGFYYDSKEDKFVRFPKAKPVGIAGLIFNKAPRPTADKIPYVQKGTLPPEYSHLQERFNEFLATNNLKIGGTSLLLDGPNSYKPKVKIAPKEGAPKGTCFLCGNPSHTLTEIGSTIFPMISGSSGALTFNSGCADPAKVCWKCDYIAKFVPVTGFYVTSGGNTHMYFPYSVSLQKVQEVFASFESMKIRDPYYLRNFNPDLGGYFNKPYEQFFSFIYSVYSRILSSSSPDDTEDARTPFDYEKMYDLALSRAPLEIIVLYTEALGDTSMGKLVWPFKESIYMFRLFERLESQGVSLDKTMQILVDYDQKNDDNKTLLRNRICERILKQQGVVSLVEQHVFHINSSKAMYIKPVFDFVVNYEKILSQEKNPMKQELIDTAVSLGKTIGLKLGAEGKKGKGDLFRLRKTRRPEDFLNEVNRIQMKYDASVTADLYQNGEAFEKHFVEFKQFCMIAALNSYNAVTRRDEGK